MSILKGSLQTFATRGASRAVLAFCGIFVTRCLGPHDKGLYVYAVFIASIVLQFTYGAATSIARQWGRQKLPVEDVYASSMIMGAATLLVSVSVCAALAVYVPGQSILSAACIALPFMFFSQISQGFFLTAARQNAFNIQPLISQVAVSVVSAVVLPLFHVSLNGVLCIWILGQVGCAVYSAVILRDYVPSLLPKAPNADILRDHLTFAVRSGALALAAFANTRIDVLVVMLVLGPTALGVYSVAIALVDLLWMISKSVAAVAYAGITTHDPEKAAALAARCIRHTLLISAAASVALIFIAPLAVNILFGRSFGAAGTAFALLAPGAILWSAMDIMTIYFTSQQGRPIFLTAVQVACALICGIVTFVCAHSLGIFAGAVGTTIAYSVGTLITGWMFLRSASSARSLVRFERSDILVYFQLFERIRRAAIIRS